jgi:hypothetical protein
MKINPKGNYEINPKRNYENQPIKESNPRNPGFYAFPMEGSYEYVQTI